MAAIERGLHVLITKPAVKTLEHHLVLEKAARAKGVFVMVEVHKRFDPIYVDARDRIQKLGGCSFFQSYMSQPKHQLQTFKAWAGKSSDISYYLNSHHVDFHEWALLGKARPLTVTAIASTGVAKSLGIETEDTITLTVQWQNLSDKTLGTGIYTSSWIAPKADVHSQQRFFYMGHTGEITVDQAHRGYNVANDGPGFATVNPLFMKYEATNGKFSGQQGYGYRSFEQFIGAAQAINAGTLTVKECDQMGLATIGTTLQTTAILEAGRISLDKGNAAVKLVYTGDDSTEPVALEV